MVIAVNTRFLLQGRLEGIGWFTYETVKRMVQNHPEHQFVFLFDRPCAPEFIFGKNVTPVVVSPPARHPLLWWWFERSLPAVLQKVKADVFLSPDGYGSLRTEVPTVLVVHDLAFEHYPEHLAFWAKTFYRRYTPLYARKARRLATVSDFSKADLIKQYGITSDKIDVVYNGFNAAYRPLSEEEKNQVRAQFTGGAEYLLFVGALHPRKNIERLMLAFDLFKEKNPSSVKMLIVGRRAWHTSSMERTYRRLRHRDDVIFAGHRQIDVLPKLMGAALGLTYVSLFEGFGIPIIEAMQTDTPVITSNVSSMPEVAGGAALLADPFSTEQIAEAMTKLYTHKNLRQELIEKGRLQRQQFSWDATAQRLWACFEKAVISSAP